MTILNETAIDSSSLGPVIRRQAHHHAGLKGSDRLTVRVMHGFPKRNRVSGRATARGVIIIIPPRLMLTEADWRRHAPQLAQLVAVLSARWSGRHARLAQWGSEKYSSTTPEAFELFAAAAEIPFALRPNWQTRALEAKLERVSVLRRHAKDDADRTRKRYQKFRNWEKTIRFRLRELGSTI